MGKIKTKLIKRTANSLMENKDIDFNEDFEKNKNILGKEMPSKKVRNQIAGYITRSKKMEKIKEAKIQESLNALARAK